MNHIPIATICPVCCKSFLLDCAAQGQRVPLHRELFNADLYCDGSYDMPLQCLSWWIEGDIFAGINYRRRATLDEYAARN